MSVRVVRQSKYRHVFGTAYKREQCFDGVRITRNAWDSNFATVNPKFIAVALEAQGGGQFQVFPHDAVGRIDLNYPKVSGHQAPILDLQFCPFNDNVIASCAEDCTVRVWEIPDGGLTEDITQAVVTLEGHQRRVGIIEWHPTAENLLFSAGFDYLILLWDVSTGQLLRDINVHTDTIYSMSFSYDGTLLATTSKDKVIRVIDARSGAVISQGVGHDGSKAARVVFAGQSNRLITTGFSRSSERQYALWDHRDLSKPLKLEMIDTSSGVIFPYFDVDTGVVYFVGKGDGNIRFYEIIDEAPWAYFISEFKSAAPQRGAAWMPKRGCSISDCEIARCYKLHPKGTIEPIGFTVPRKSTLFQDDIFPPTREDAAVLTIQEFLAGTVRLPRLVSLKGDQATSVRQLFSPPAASAPAAAAAAPKPAPAPVAAAPVKKPTPAATPSPVPAASSSSSASTASSSSSADPPQGEANLIRAWYAQQREIEDLKKRIAQLEGR